MERIKKSDVVYTIVWLGSGDGEGDDLDRFSGELNHIHARQGHFFSYAGVESYRFNKRQYLKQLAEMYKAVSHLAKNAQERHVMFLILSPDIIKAFWYKTFLKGLARNVMASGNLLVQIICCDYSEEGLCPSCLYSENGLFWPIERHSRSLGALFCYSKGNTPGILRLAELINRIMGGDLDNDEFPLYTFEECMLIAWNLNREDFNNHKPRRGAISKYPIGEDGRPIFAIPVSSLLALPAPPTILLE